MCVGYELRESSVGIVLVWDFFLNLQLLVFKGLTRAEEFNLYGGQMASPPCKRHHGLLACPPYVETSFLQDGCKDS